jgi:hypothetical protein
VFFHAPSHRIRTRIDTVLGRHPLHYWRMDNQRGGVYFWLDAPAEIEKALAAGAIRCRNQDAKGYLRCW